MIGTLSGTLRVPSAFYGTRSVPDTLETGKLFETISLVRLVQAEQGVTAVSDQDILTSSIDAFVPQATGTVAKGGSQIGEQARLLIPK